MKPLGASYLILLLENGRKPVRIARIHALGEPESLVIEDVEAPVPGPGQLLVEVSACAVNFADSLILQGKYQAKPELPFGPGAEICGRIIELGPEVSGFEAGQRVIGLPGINGYAEQALISAASAVPVPEGMSDEIAASFPIAYGTSHLALGHKAHLKPGETLVVHGAAGGVGLTAVEIGKALGARVIATASTDEKLAIAKAHGADEGINSTTEDLRVRIKELTNGRGANVIYDPVGGEVFNASLRAIDFEGRILVIGFAGGTIPHIPANIVMVKNIDILGLNWGSYQTQRPEVLRASFRQLIDWYLEGKIKPYVSKVFSLEDTAQAIRHVMDRKAEGKVVVKP